jgi:hypothetical protein
MKQAVIESELISKVTLEIGWAIDGTAHREEQVMLLTQIDHCTHVKRCLVTPAGLRCGLMINFGADEHRL